ncbi:MAG: hypothetical protein K2P78_01015 [Gemmataceae bacterium]|nr:hypothetical protein [Gemmataceae bacterium]
MTRLLLVALAAALAPLLAPAQPKPDDYFPAAVGSRWVYKTTFDDKGNKVPEAFANVTTIKEVVKADARDGKTAVVFESQIDFGKAAANPQKNREEVVIDAGGVASVRGGPKPVPPLPMLKYPVKSGVIFTETAKDGDVDVTTTVTVKDAVEVTVPAGKFTAVVTETAVGSKTEKVTNTTWYAPGVGVVKQVFAADKLTITQELKSYSPPGK